MLPSRNISATKRQTVLVLVTFVQTQKSYGLSWLERPFSALRLTRRANNPLDRLDFLQINMKEARRATALKGRSSMKRI